MIGNNLSYLQLTNIRYYIDFALFVFILQPIRHPYAFPSTDVESFRTGQRSTLRNTKEN